MTPLRQRMLDDLRIRNYSPRTIDCYIDHVARFARHFGRCPADLSVDDVRAYQVYLVQQRKVSWSLFNQAVCALRFFYSVTLGRHERIAHIAYAKRPRRLPSVLSASEAQQLFACVRSLKLRTLLHAAYSAGLRLSEVLGLRVTDIDSRGMVLHVRQGKGRKDRMVPLSPRLLDELRLYWQAERPTIVLFPGQRPQQSIHPSTVQRVVQQAAAQAGLRKRVTPHTLRHSYATSQMEAGIELPTLQRLLGHGQLSTTALYLHVSTARMLQGSTPLDRLPLAPPPGRSMIERPAEPPSCGSPMSSNVSPPITNAATA